ncbi:hypothetical protein M0804_014665 [Polistes exclamans]|nr:hypothetical protein M0804_014666 [Polistes exclamans]KAI4474798.1 hypothetical protein M0804_014665 [Polistes exclamans]
MEKSTGVTLGIFVMVNLSQGVGILLLDSFAKEDYPYNVIRVSTVCLTRFALDAQRQRLICISYGTIEVWSRQYALSSVSRH